MAPITCREMQQTWRNQVSDLEKKINNPSNLPHYHKNCLMPDILYEIVSKRVLYQPAHGPNKDRPESLIPQRMFVLHDNIEVPDLETSEYTSVDAPVYKAAMDEEMKHMGYSKLIKVDEFSLPRLKKQKQSSSDSETSQTTDSSSGVPTKMAKYDSKSKSAPKLANSRDSVAFIKASNSTLNHMETDEESDSTYDYTTIRDVNTPKPLSRDELVKNIEFMSTLPDNCLTMRLIKNSPEDFETEKTDEDGEVVQKPMDLFYKQWYFNSVMFMKHFRGLFKMELGSRMNFTKEQIEKATSAGCTIYIRGDFNISYEIYPAIGIAWPKSAFEWMYRVRKEYEDKTKKVIYKWPTDKMREKIRNLDCVLLPHGFVPKRGSNEESILEWTISFPKAERYLETRMSHAQVRCYLFVLTLYKAFLEPKYEKLGLSVHHIRNHMFWLCELNYMDWPEDQMGAKIVKVLQKLVDCLAKDNLPDYFIYNKNLLKNVPSKYINVCQEKLHRILENPVMYFLSAFRNLTYVTNKFYPKLDFTALYDIITSTDSLKTANPQLSQMEPNDEEEEYQSSESEDEFQYSKKKDAGQIFNQRFYEQQEAKRKRAKKKRELEEKQKALERKTSEDSINYEYLLSVKDYRDDPIKRQNLLIFFIKHFIQIAKTSKTFNAIQQALLYLNQARHLAILLNRINAGEAKAQEFLQTIRKLEEECKMRSLMEPQVPLTPRRNSAFIIPETALKIQVSSNTILDKSKLERNFNLNSAPELKPVPKKKKAASFNNVEIRADIHEDSRRVTRTRSRPNSFVSFADNTTETTDL